MAAVTGHWRARSAEAITFQWRSEQGEIMRSASNPLFGGLFAGLFYNTGGGAVTPPAGFKFVRDANSRLAKDALGRLVISRVLVN